MSNLNDIFTTVPTIEQPISQSSRADEFNPSAKNSKTGTYTAIVRFVPWHANPPKSIMSKSESFLTDPISKESRVVDSLKNFQQNCPILNTFWSLYNSGDASLQSFVKKHINTYTSYASIVQVIKDDIHPENNGKMLVWRYKKTIWDKLYNEAHPQYGINPQPFDIINGRYFAVNVVLKSGFNNYDNCQFLNSQSSGIYITDTNGNFFQVDGNTDKQSIYNYLVNNSPDLNKYEAKKWDENTSSFVTKALENINKRAQIGTMSSNIGIATNPTMNSVMSTNNISSPNIETSPLATDFCSSLDSPSNNEELNHTKMNNMPSLNTPTPPNISGIDLPSNNFPNKEIEAVGLGLGLDEIVGAI